MTMMKILASTVLALGAAGAQASMPQSSDASFAQLAGQAGQELKSLVGGETAKQEEALVDNTVAVAVPEPETYALMLGGLVAMGVAIRRRRR